MILTSLRVEDFARMINVPADEVITGLQLSLCGKVVDIRTEKKKAVDVLVEQIVGARVN